MPSGDAAIKSGPRVGVPERTQFTSGNNVHQRPWFADERDAFISWLRSEFAAANAIIDSLCYHLRCVGEPGEYEVAIGCIQQRRSPWTPIIHMQQYFSIADIGHALQQVAWRQQTRQPNPATMTGSFPHPQPDSKKPATHIAGGRHMAKGTSTENARGAHRSDWDSQCVNEEASDSSVNVKKNSESDPSGTEIHEIHRSKHESSESFISHENNERMESERMGNNGFISEANETKSGDEKEGNCQTVQKNDINARMKQDEKPLHVLTPQTFMGTEILDGMTVNVVEGLELYEDFLDSSEVTKLFSLANELRAAARRGELQGQTFVPSKRPMKGRGRDILQFGVPIIDGPPEDNNGTLAYRDHKVEPIPSTFLDIVDRLVKSQVMTVKPDSCVIDFFNEGDHSQPHTYPSWFGRPFCSLFLTNCSAVFGKISIDHPGDFRGTLKLPLSAGSVLVFKGKSADFAKHALPSIRKQRIIVTFTKPQSKRMYSDASQHSPWGHRSRPPSMIRYPGPKHYNRVPSTGVLPGPRPRPQHLAPADVPSIFVAASVPPPPVVYQPPTVPVATAGWPSVPRSAQPRGLVPGTGVFLPPDPGQVQSQQQGGVISGETSSVVESSTAENLPMNGPMLEKNQGNLDLRSAENTEPKSGGPPRPSAGKVETDETVNALSSTEGGSKAADTDVSKQEQGGNASEQSQ